MMLMMSAHGDLFYPKITECWDLCPLWTEIISSASPRPALGPEGIT